MEAWAAVRPGKDESGSSDIGRSTDEAVLEGSSRHRGAVPGEFSTVRRGRRGDGPHRHADGAARMGAAGARAAARQRDGLQGVLRPLLRRARLSRVRRALGRRRRPGRRHRELHRLADPPRPRRPTTVLQLYKKGWEGHLRQYTAGQDDARSRSRGTGCTTRSSPSCSTGCTTARG